MKEEIKLSYILTTFNKIEYLKISLPVLIKECKEDEEIVITDGGSTDGTVDYLTDLYKAGKIHQFVSEKDFGEAHGTNKAILMAKGEFIKLITDDDVFFYPGIQACKRFMQENPTMDVVAGNIGVMNLDRIDTINYSYDSQHAFCEWMKTGKTIFFCGLSLMMRRKSIPRMGLFHTNFIAIDVEFTTRITKLNLNIAWYTSALVAAIVNPQSNTLKTPEKSRQQEEKKVSHFYNWDMSNRYNTLLSRLMTVIKNIARPFTTVFTNRKKEDYVRKHIIEKEIIENFAKSMSEKFLAFTIAGYWLKDFNRIQKADFLYKK